MINYRTLFPTEGEDRSSYCSRLENDGHEEMFIRKALRVHWGMELSTFSDFFEGYPDARMRHIALVHSLKPTRTNYSLALKLAKNLGISLSQVEIWVERFQQSRKT